MSKEAEVKATAGYTKVHTSIPAKKAANQNKAHGGTVVPRVPNEGARQRPGKNTEPLDQSGEKGSPRHNGRELPPGAAVIGVKK
jgi:hypothetical protein